MNDKTLRHRGEYSPPGECSRDNDVFARLGIEPDDVELTPLRLRELEASAARLRELEARRAGVTLTSFTFTVRDTALGAFTWEARFDPPLEQEGDGDMSPAEYIGGRVVLLVDALIRRGLRGDAEHTEKVEGGGIER